MKKILAFSLVLSSLFFIHYSLFPAQTLAHCPLCVAGAGVGLTLARFLGIDDAITGVWMGAFLGAISFWTETLIKDKDLKLKVRPILYIGIFWVTLWSFYKFNLVVTMGTIFGLHKLTFGILAGGTLFYLIDFVDDLVIRAKGKILFPYQRLAASLGGMVALSFIIYYLLNYVI